MKIELPEGGYVVVEAIESVVIDRLPSRSERLFMESLGSDKRRREWLAWRTVVYNALGRSVKIKYDPSGAPHATKWGRERVRIGVSHSRTHVAVVFSPRQCAVDIESASRDFSRVADRYISKQEYRLPQHEHSMFKAALWCAKEAWFKWLSIATEVDLKEDLRVTFTDLHRGTVCGTFRGEPLPNASLWSVDGEVVCAVESTDKPTDKPTVTNDQPTDQNTEK